MTGMQMSIKMILQDPGGFVRIEGLLTGMSSAIYVIVLFHVRYKNLVQASRLL